MFTYWCQVFILSKAVMEGSISFVGNSFGDHTLWHGKFLWGSFIVRSTLCLPKQVGGMGVKDNILRNTALVAKLLWQVPTKADGVWIKWVPHYIWMRICNAFVTQYKLVCHKYRIPKCAFITWLALHLHRRLSAVGRLIKMGLS